MNHLMQKGQRFIVPVIVALTAGIFLLELAASLGITSWALYLLPLLLTLWAPHPRAPIVLAVIVSGLTILDLFLSEFIVTWGVAVLSHVMAVGLFGATAMLIMKRKAAERESRAVLETALDGLLIVDRTGNILEANDAYCCLSGHSRDELLAMHVSQIEAKESPEDVARHIEKVIRIGGERFETRHRRKDGSIVDVEISARYVSQEGGKCFFFIHDIAERKQAESNLATQYVVTRVLAEAPPLANATLKILQVIGKHTGWDVGMFWTVDESVGSLRCVEVWDREVSEAGKTFATEIQSLTLASGMGLLGRVWATGKPAWCADIAQVSDCPAASSAARRGLHGVLAVPIWSGTAFFGVMALFSVQAREPAPGLVPLLVALSCQIGQFMARKQAEEARQEADTRSRLLLDSTGEGIYGLDGQLRCTFINKAGAAMLGYQPHEMIGRNMHELVHHSHLNGSPYHDEACPILASVRQGQAHWLSADVFWRRDRMALPVEISSYPIRDGPAEIKGAVVVFSDRTVRQREEDLRVQLIQTLLTAQEEERKRIARELHDEAVQSFAAVLVGLREVEEAGTLEAARRRATELQSVAARALDELQRLVMGLRPSLLDDLGLEAALQRFCEEFSRGNGIPVDLHIDGLAGHRLPSMTEIALYRFVQEALTNTAKHAAATEACVLIQAAGASVRLIVEDNGRGCDVDAVRQAAGKTRHLGLYGMQERATLLGGTFTIESALGQGTTVFIDIPFLHPGALS